jgi:hypothetical protein
MSNFSVTVCHGVNKDRWDDNDGRFVLDQHAELDFYTASSLKEQSTSRHVAPIGQIFQIPTQPVFVLIL